jgi:HEAT repeat protein
MILPDMELPQIEADLQNADFQYRLRAIAALKDYPSEVAVPILERHAQDPEFLVRSFVARELGRQQTSASFAALLQIMKLDNTPNVRAEAANSLSLFGRVAASHLVQAFFIDDHWLVRRSILPALAELDCPEELLEVCAKALTGDDLNVQEEAIDALATLTGSRQHEAALTKILSMKNTFSEGTRMHVAYALKRFSEPIARDGLAELRQDSNHRVVGAAMEDLIR